MASQAAAYPLIDDFVGANGDPEYAAPSPHWVLCVVRLGLPLSYSRAQGKSVTSDSSQGARLRGDNLIIVSDCVSLNINSSKDQHTEALMAELKQTDHNYLTEILPGDWVLAWIVNDETSFNDLLKRIKDADASKPCNGFSDGLKFVGRIDNVRKHVRLDRGAGVKMAGTTITGVGFRELDSQFFYDHNLAENDVLSGNIGSWLAKLGLDLESLFAVDIKNGQKNNARFLINSLIDLIVGKGVSSRVNPTGNSALQAATGANATGEAPFAYLVPRVVGAFLGIKGSSKTGGIMSYADIMTTLMGVQSYSSTQAQAGEGGVFVPTLDGTSTANRYYTGSELLGTFLPVMPEFTNKPLWSVLQQFLNPTVNEMYTALRVNKDNRVVPTLVVRQIPFTTEAFTPPSGSAAFKVTKFLTLPRWKIHPTLINDLDIGRSDSTRINFVHIYGQDSNSAQQVTFTEQLVLNPPARDDLDIQRSGLRSYMTTVACATKDQVGQAPSAWIALTADRLIGSQYTLNGSLGCFGIVSPIAKGDNLELDDTVYHIESLTHTCSIDAGGHKSFTTNMTLTNGMRGDGTSDVGSGNGGSGTGETPIYPGLKASDNTAFDPGATVDDKFERTAPSTDRTDLDSLDPQERGFLDVLNKL